MASAVQAPLENLVLTDAEPSVRVLHSQSRVLVLVNGQPISSYDASDKGAMHVAAVSLAEAGVAKAQVIAHAFGITPVHLSRMRGSYKKEGARGVVAGRTGPKGSWKMKPEVISRIRELHALGWKNSRIAGEVGVSRMSVSRILVSPATEQELLPINDPKDEATTNSPECSLRDQQAAEPPLDTVESAGKVASEFAGALDSARRETLEREETSDSEAASDEPVLPETLPTEPHRIHGAGAMLLHPFLHSLGLVPSFEAAGAHLGPFRLFDLNGTLGVLAMGFGLGIRNVEGLKLAQRLDLGLAACLPWAPEVRTLRRKLDELAESTDPVLLTRELARSLMRLEPVWESVYFVDGHFVDYSGELPVPKGWDPRRQRPARGRTDTYVHDIKGRPLFFVSSEVNEGLTQAMPRIVEEILNIAGENADIHVFFDRGGFSQDLFARLIEQNVGFTTYVKGTPAQYVEPGDQDFQKRWYAFQGRRRYFHLAEGELTLGPYTYRLIVLRDKGRLIPVVTNDWKEPAAKLVLILKMRWRQENSFKDLVENYWVDGLVEYGGQQEPDGTMGPNPQRAELRIELARLRRERLELEAQLGRQVLGGAGGSSQPELPNTALAEQRLRNIAAREQSLTEALECTPARLPRNEMDPEAVRALLRTGKRTLVKGIKHAVHNAEHYLARLFLKHLGDPDEYRAIFRSLLRQPGDLHYDQVTRRVRVCLVPPDTPRVARALEALLEELNGMNPKTLDGRWSIRYELAGVSGT